MLKPSSINVMHLLLIGPYLTYMGLYGHKCSPICFKILTIVGLLVIVFHAYRLYVNMNKVSVHSLGEAVTNTISDINGQVSNIGNQLIGKDNSGNNVVIDEAGNVATVDEAGNVLNMNNEAANESANQAMANNNMANNVM